MLFQYLRGHQQVPNPQSDLGLTSSTGCFFSDILPVVAAGIEVVRTSDILNSQGSELELAGEPGEPSLPWAPPWQRWALLEGRVQVRLVALPSLLEPPWEEVAEAEGVQLLWNKVEQERQEMSGTVLCIDL